MLLEAETDSSKMQNRTYHIRLSRMTGTFCQHESQGSLKSQIYKKRSQKWFEFLKTVLEQHWPLHDLLRRSLQSSFVRPTLWYLTFRRIHWARLLPTLSTPRSVKRKLTLWQWITGRQPFLKTWAKNLENCERITILEISSSAIHISACKAVFSSFKFPAESGMITGPTTWNIALSYVREKILTKHVFIFYIMAVKR